MIELRLKPLEMKTMMTRGDKYMIETIEDIMNNGYKDINPRPKYADGTPAHTISVNHKLYTFDLANGNSPFTTLRPIAIKSAIGEILWIYQDQSNSLDLFRDKYGVTWWDEWDIGNRTIGACYGETVRRHNLMDRLLARLKNDPDGRRHIMNLWQEDDFKEAHGLKPCCFMTVWNVVNKPDGKYLDCMMYQRSSDYLTAGTINCLQYIALHYMVAGHCGYKVGKFSWFNNNVQIYDRHIDNAKILLNREPIKFSSVEKMPRFEVEPKNFYDYTVDDIKIVNYPKDEVKEKNPQLKFDLGI